MKKLLFLLAGSLFAFTAQAQEQAQTGETLFQVGLSDKVETKWEGVCPDYGDGDLYAIFVKIQHIDHSQIVSVDPVPIAARRADGVWEKVADQSSVLLDYRVWLDPDNYGTVHYEVTYQYPGWPVRTVSSSFSYI